MTAGPRNVFTLPPASSEQAPRPQQHRAEDYRQQHELGDARAADEHEAGEALHLPHDQGPDHRPGQRVHSPDQGRDQAAEEEEARHLEGEEDPLGRRHQEPPLSPPERLRRSR